MRADILSLADLYIAHYEAGLQGKNRETVQGLKSQLATLRAKPVELRAFVNNLVSQLTIALADMKSADAITVSAAYLVKVAPTNFRTLNLFGAVLHAAKRLKDGASVYEYALTQSQGNVLLILNLAKIDLDLKKDAASKSLLDQLVRLEQMNRLSAPDVRDTYQTLMLYWFRQGNMVEYKNCILKASTFVGFVRNKQQAAEAVVEERRITEDDDLPTMAAKARQLKTLVPLNTADVVEQDLPDVARQIRDKVGRLGENDRMRLLSFPQVDTSSNQSYTEAGPIVAAWIQTFMDKDAEYTKGELLRTTGINPETGAGAGGAQAQQLGQDQIKKALQGAQDAMRFLQQGQTIPGIDPALVSSSLAKVNSAAAQAGVRLDDNPLDTDYPPGFDSGGLFSFSNYLNYVSISRSYELYMERYFQDYDAKDLNIQMIYLDKVVEERKRHDEVQTKLDADHAKGLHGTDDIPCRTEKIKNRKNLNALGNTSFKSWVNLYAPEYQQKMKPVLEDYWATTLLYIRNMNDPDVAAREYYRVKGVFMQNAVKITTMAAKGGMYEYVGSTDEEEKALAAIERAAFEEARAKEAAEFVPGLHVNGLRPYPEPVVKDDWVEWIGRNLVVEVELEVLKFKITAKTIEFEAFAPLLDGMIGQGGGVKIDLLDDTLETYTFFGGKFQFGGQVGTVKAGLEVTVESYRQTAQWDLDTGKYQESLVPGSKLNVKASLGTASLEGEVTVDATLKPKYQAKANLDGVGSVDLKDASLTLAALKPGGGDVPPAPFGPISAVGRSRRR